MDKVASLRSFVKAVETGSFAEAGRQLRLSRSAAHSNEPGLTVLSERDAADQALAHAQSTPSGPLRINPPMSFSTLWLGPIAEFMENYPALKLQAVLSDDLLAPVQDGFDVALRIAELESSSLIARKIAPIVRAFCASPDYLERHGTPL